MEAVEKLEWPPRAGLQELTFWRSQRRGSAAQRREDRRGDLGVLQGAMRATWQAEVLGHEVQRVAVELGKQKEGGLQRVEGRVGERRLAGAARLQRQPFEVEGQVLTHERRRADEGAQLRVRVGEARRAGQ